MSIPTPIKGQVGQLNHRHGDVLPTLVKPPSRTGRQRLSHYTLAEGEVTGHAHRLVSPDSLFRQDAKGNWFLAEEVGTPDAELYLHKGSLYVRARSTVALIHEDHSAMMLARGTYLVEIQREWSPEGEVRVAD